MDKSKKHIINVCKNFDINYILNEKCYRSEKLWNEIIFSHLFWYFSMFFFKKSQCFFLFFYNDFFLNLTVILSILTAFLRLIRVKASHEAYKNNLGNTFMATIACSLKLTHMNLGTNQWPLIAGWGVAFLPELRMKKSILATWFLCSLRFIIRTDEHTHIHTRMHARTDTYHSPPVYQRSLICTQVHDHVRKIIVIKVFPELI